MIVRIAASAVAMTALVGAVRCAGPRRFETRGMKTSRTEVNAGALPPGPSVVVVTADAGTSTVDRYRRAGQPGDPLPSGPLLLAIVRSGPLSTADTLDVSDLSKNGSTFRLTLDWRRYTGPISANVEREVLVEAELGTLSAGRYVIVVTTTTLEFRDRQHPERTANPSQTEDRAEFDVR